MTTAGLRSLPVLDSGATLPLPFAPWLGQLLPGGIPNESMATCDNCVMCTDGADAPSLPSPVAFHPGVKCCSFFPRLANFQVGAILSDTDTDGAEGRAALERLIAAGHAVTPLAVGPTAAFIDAYDAAGDKRFGQVPALRCPYYVDVSGGQCGIWRHRNSVCSTWFCRHIRGRMGKQFWVELRELLKKVEAELALWCLVELGADAASLQRVLHAEQSSREGRREHARLLEIDPVAAAAAHKESWGSWAGREHRFYRSCHTLVSQLDWAAVMGLCGQRVRAHAELVQQSFAALAATPTLDHLRLGEFTARADHGHVHIAAYSRFDTIRLTNREFAALRHFDGGDLASVLARAHSEDDLELGAELVSRLVDLGVLRSDEPA